MVVLENRLQDFSEIKGIVEDAQLNLDLINCLIGEKIGSGSFRDVFEYNLHPTKYVIKVENNRNLYSRCNIAEQLLYEEIKGLKNELEWVKDWFAPILWVSPSGRLLVMERTEEKPNKKIPENIPAFFSDVKWDNFGWIGNKFVCHDYGFLYKFISYSRKIQKIKW